MSNVHKPRCLVRDADTGEVIPAASLEGLHLEGGWRVAEPLPRSQPHRTGGNNSFGYRVEHEDGSVAFLKALDYREAMRDDDVPVALQQMTGRFIFERTLLEKLSQDRKLSRIVRVLAAGGIDLDVETKYPHVDYLILERADGDLREVLTRSSQVDDIWRLNCLKDVAAALQQIHPKVAHGDLKPSNAMVFKRQGRTKLGDFGSATGIDMPHPDIGEIEVFNDPRYSPPELQYGYSAPEWRERFLAVDLYLLANLTVFLMDGGNNLTTEVIGRLPIGMRPGCESGNWMGSFAGVLPHLEKSFATYLSELEARLAGRLGPKVAAGLVDIVHDLGWPDPAKRGHRRNRRQLFGDPYSLERTVSAFATLAREARVMAKRQQAAVEPTS